MPALVINRFTPLQTLPARLVEKRRLTPEGSPNEVDHLVFRLPEGAYPYVEGQSAGIVAPGLRPDGSGKPHKPRLYSIASPGKGEKYEPDTLALCVKRALAPKFGVPDGVCSSYLCDLQVGDVVQLTGPSGKSFVMPDDPDANLVMFATGTGYAPFRAFLERRLLEQEAGESGNGQNWLFFGFQKSGDFLYADEFPAIRDRFRASSVGQGGASFKLVTAVSRLFQEKPSIAREGFPKKAYVQHRLSAYAHEILPLLNDPKTYVYICGLKGMQNDIEAVFAEAAKTYGVDWPELFATLKQQKRWHVEVY